MDIYIVLRGKDKEGKRKRERERRNKKGEKRKGERKIISCSNRNLTPFFNSNSPLEYVFSVYEFRKVFVSRVCFLNNGS